MPVPVQSAPGSIGESRQIPEERWAAEPAGPEVRKTGPSAGTTGTSASAGPTGPARTDTPSSRSHRAQLQDSGRVASDSGRKSRSPALPGICRVWASSMRELSVPPRSGRVRQLRLPPRRLSRKRRDSLAEWRDRTRRSGASREEYLSPPLQFMRTGRSGACFTWNTRYEIHRVEGPPRARLFHVEHQVRDPQSRGASSGAPVSRGTPGTRSTESSGPPQTTAPDQKSGRFAGTPTRRGYRSDVGPTLRRSW
jgi:hypothetical protein